ncbi:DUF413 domain-containing protein [Idiomarina xiamenensis]|uniref:Macrodomain Ori protein n=1 Tax=Idiomarina xiamenensis 10-D-4 TaxID=740709 RepID=K2JM10_9GAMM|nr:DUF413 domain-containing protein [Idiomarina xiamenensis]EKE84541.1 hypothetical protein A10D4_05717 [Idiomarina xiamenensis 10-D-4]
MATITRDQLIRKPFNDFRNYPYGFARSGDFSIRESDALTQYGCLISAMLDGQYVPTSAEDVALLAAARGENAPQTAVEKAWAKYQARINRPKVASMYGRGRVSDDSLDTDSSEDDVLVED